MLPCEPIAVNAWRRSKSSRHGRAVRWKRSRITIGFGITATLSSPPRPGRSADFDLRPRGGRLTEAGTLVSVESLLASTGLRTDPLRGGRGKKDSPVCSRGWGGRGGG